VNTGVAWHSEACILYIADCVAFSELVLQCHVTYCCLVAVIWSILASISRDWIHCLYLGYGMSKLLVNYPQQERDQILDFLFKVWHFNKVYIFLVC